MQNIITPPCSNIHFPVCRPSDFFSWWINIMLLCLWVLQWLNASRIKIKPLNIANSSSYGLTPPLHPFTFAPAFLPPLPRTSCAHICLMMIHFCSLMKKNFKWCEKYPVWPRSLVMPLKFSMFWGKFFRFDVKNKVPKYLKCKINL